MGLNFDKYAEQTSTEDASSGGGGSFVGRIPKGNTHIRWVVPVSDNEDHDYIPDVSQAYQDAFVKAGIPTSVSNKRVIYAIISDSPLIEGSGGFLPYGWNGDWSKVEHEETLAHAAKFNHGRRVVPLSLSKTLHDALKEAGSGVDDPVTYVNFATGEIVSAGAVYRLTREGEGQKNTKYNAVVLNRKADVAKIDGVIGQGIIVTPPTETLAEYAEGLRAANAAKIAGAAETAKPTTQF